MKVASRLRLPYSVEKCPVCLEVGGAVPFFELELGGVPILICAKPACRCLFVPSFVDLKALIEAESEVVVEPDDTSLTCRVCGKECKSALGLGSHMRSHNG